MKSEESKSKAKEIFKHQQEVVKRWFDKHKAGNKEFEVGDFVLKWDHPHDEKGKHTKCCRLIHTLRHRKVSNPLCVSLGAS